MHICILTRTPTVHYYEIDMSQNTHLANQAYNLFDFEPEFREYLGAVINLKKISIRNYLSDIRYFFGWVQSHKSGDIVELSLPTVFTSDLLMTYKQVLIDEQVPMKTINRRLSSLRCLGDYLVSQGIITQNPAKHIQNHGLLHKKGLKDADITTYVEYLASQGTTTQLQEEIRLLLTDMGTFVKNSPLHHENAH